MRTALTRAVFPWEKFRLVCERGLASVRPFAQAAPPDAFGWSHGRARPPSY